MTRGEQLVSLGDQLVEFLPTIAAQTGIQASIKLHGGDLNQLACPSFGVFLSVPDPTIEQRMIHGENALHLWHYTIIASVPSLTHEQGLIRALDALGAVRRALGNPGTGFGELVPATPFYEIYDNQATNTVVAITYEYNWQI